VISKQWMRLRVGPFGELFCHFYPPSGEGNFYQPTSIKMRRRDVVFTLLFVPKFCLIWTLTKKKIAGYFHKFNWNFIVFSYRQHRVFIKLWSYFLPTWNFCCVTRDCKQNRLSVLELYDRHSSHRANILFIQ